MRVASDSGGTFTDLVAEDGTIAKVPSTPDDPGEAVRDGLRQLAEAVGSGTGARLAAPEVATVLVHGTTVATNALLERRGARVALVTNAGFGDVIEIARQDRPSLYDPAVVRPEALVPRSMRYEVTGRLDARGHELEPVDPAALASLVDEIGESGAEAVAVCLLHADLNPAHEAQVADALRRRGMDVTASYELSPEMREYERTVTAAANAYLRPRCRSYVEELSRAARSVMVMTSAGGLVPAPVAAERPAALLLSGPTGGVIAGAAAARANGWPDAVTFDMGGTSTDVCLVLDGRPGPAAVREVAGFPIRMPSLAVHTIGAGGGSIAAIDSGGALAVGPRSAGAVPGPACYGRGASWPTVTDANLVAGRLGSEVTLPGIGPLDRSAAERALNAAGVGAEGVLRVVNAHMAQALRHVSVERGVDPRGLTLVAFGGAGPLHACDLADALGMPRVLVPARAGVLSAVGILAAPTRVDLVASWADPLDHSGLAAAVAEMIARAHRTVIGWTSDAPVSGPGDRPARVDPVPSAGARPAGPFPPLVTASLDCRYHGQSHELAVPFDPDDQAAAWREVFHVEHERHNGYARRSQPVEVVALRVSAEMPSPVGVESLPAPDRQGAVGPAVIREPDCTIWVPDQWRADPGAAGALVLTRT